MPVQPGQEDVVPDVLVVPGLDLAQDGHELLDLQLIEHRRDDPQDPRLLEGRGGALDDLVDGLALGLLSQGSSDEEEHGQPAGSSAGVSPAGWASGVSPAGGASSASGGTGGTSRRVFFGLVSVQTASSL